MSAPDPEVLHKVQQWLAYADEDLALARHGLTMAIAAPPYRLIAYPLGISLPSEPTP